MNDKITFENTDKQPTRATGKLKQLSMELEDLRLMELLEFYEELQHVFMDLLALIVLQLLERKQKIQKSPFLLQLLHH